jgi:hypothetical protein
LLIFNQFSWLTLLSVSDPVFLVPMTAEVSKIFGSRIPTELNIAEVSLYSLRLSDTHTDIMAFSSIVVWPGVTVWPDWFNNNTHEFWKTEFANFFNPETGIDIDGVWIDMNEPASFCKWPCLDPFAEAINQGLPPNRTSLPPPADAPLPIDPAVQRRSELYRRTSQYTDVLFPPYAINNAAGNLSDNTAFTDVVHANGLIMYDTRKSQSSIL